MELQNPHNYQPHEKFDKWTKYAWIICNQFYDRDYITHGDLPAVSDDFKKAKHICKMMGIPIGNTFEMNDASYDQLERQTDWFCWRIAALTKVLRSHTGIKGSGYFIQGFLWETLKPGAMNLVAPFDAVEVELNSEEQ